jgi:hypothetical protein
MDALEREFGLKGNMEQLSREHETIERLMMMHVQAESSLAVYTKQRKLLSDPNVMSQSSIL